MAVFLCVMNLGAMPLHGRTVFGDDAPRNAAEMYSAEMRNAPSTAPISASMPDKGMTSPTVTGIVESISARRLGHKPLKIARKEFERALSQLKKRRPDEAAQHLRNAVSLDPEYVEAHAQLGSLYLRKGEAAVALEHLDAAIAIEPNAAALHSNKALALLALRRPAEAEVCARLVLRLDPSSETGHYLVSAAMVQQGHANHELLQHLEIAARKYPEAARALQELTLRRAPE